MLRRRAKIIISEYIAHYGPDRYGRIGWPAEAEGLDVQGVDARMRELLREVESRSALDETKAAHYLREAAAVVEFVAADISRIMAEIDAKHGQVFRTAAIISGEDYSAYMRLLMERQHLQEARRSSSGLRSLARKFDRRR
ncbi:hypothetical protein RI578_38060 [Streptomyces sp. BB1-1-1]|uniref:hypothetical protein n=1 Tax=Streptomyces sp. BB1-1-1 TaxID=3074430 RepID=UPI002877725F|nr:hypothetical protein [Streptomyces sp. BB1-1-1]WND39745.1 hypothetical protein RI578_38060 [Streptomyces sp. BB1-1-1]